MSERRPVSPSFDPSDAAAARESRATREERLRARRGERVRRTLTLMAGVLLVGALAAGAYASWMYSNLARRIAPSEQEIAPIRQALDTPEAPAEGEVDPAVYVLLLGNDRRPGQGWGRSDSMILARLEPQTGRVSLLSFPRDSRVSIPGHGSTKIAHATAYGGPALAIKTVKRLTGLPVNHYVQIDFEGFSSMIDAVGGVRVNVDRGAVSPEGVRITAGKQVLSGREALTFARNRKGYADGDFARMRNQQTVLMALGKKIVEPGNIKRLPRVIDSISRHIQTDMSVPDALELASNFRNISKKTVKSKSAPGRTASIGGGSYVLLDEAKLKAMIEDLEDEGFGYGNESQKQVPHQALSE